MGDAVAKPAEEVIYHPLQMNMEKQWATTTNSWPALS